MCRTGPVLDAWIFILQRSPVQVRSRGLVLHTRKDIVQEHKINSISVQNKNPCVENRTRSPHPEGFSAMVKAARACSPHRQGLRAMLKSRLRHCARNPSRRAWKGFVQRYKQELVLQMGFFRWGWCTMPVLLKRIARMYFHRCRKQMQFSPRKVSCTNPF